MLTLAVKKKTDIASLGSVYKDKREVPYFEISGTADIAVSDVKEPSISAVGPVNIVTPASYPNIVATMIGKAVDNKALLKDLIAAAAPMTTAAIPVFKALVDASTSPASVPDPTVGQNMTCPPGFCGAGQAMQITVANRAESAHYGSYATAMANYNAMGTWYTWGGHEGYYTAGGVHSDGVGGFYFVSQYVAWNVVEGTGAAGTPGNLDYSILGAGMPQFIATQPGELQKLMDAASTPISTLEKGGSGKATGITQGDIDGFYTKLKGDLQGIISQKINDSIAAGDGKAGDIATQGNGILGNNQGQAETTKPADPAKDPATYSPAKGYTKADKYDPGAHDIPARFTQFTDAVKSSSLFSFSNAFFNSIPSGGDSTYQIEAGQYGHHTIDLSSTMSTGLDALKAVLLACFRFPFDSCRYHEKVIYGRFQRNFRFFRKVLGHHHRHLALVLRCFYHSFPVCFLYDP